MHTRVGTWGGKKLSCLERCPVQGSGIEGFHCTMHLLCTEMHKCCSARLVMSVVLKKGVFHQTTQPKSMITLV